MVSTIPKWVDRAWAWLGEKEVPGKGANNFITSCLDTIKIPKNMANTDETPWCSAFVNKIIMDCGLPGNSSNQSGLARSWLKYGKSNGPSFGAITVLWRKSPDSTSGHVGFLMRKLNGNLHLLGGNQSDQVKVSIYPESRLLGYRWPI